MHRFIALLLATSIAGCSTVSTIATNGDRPTLARHDDDIEVAESNNDWNVMSVVFLVGTVGLLVAAIAISQQPDEKDPRCTDPTYCP